VVYGEPLVWNESDDFDTKSALFSEAMDRASAEAGEAVSR
jgi:cytochrome c556